MPDQPRADASRKARCASGAWDAFRRDAMVAAPSPGPWAEDAEKSAARVQAVRARGVVLLSKPSAQAQDGSAPCRRDAARSAARSCGAAESWAPRAQPVAPLLESERQAVPGRPVVLPEDAAQSRAAPGPQVGRLEPLLSDEPAAGERSIWVLVFPQAWQAERPVPWQPGLPPELPAWFRLAKLEDGKAPRALPGPVC